MSVIRANWTLWDATNLFLWRIRSHEEDRWPGECAWVLKGASEAVDALHRRIPPTTLLSEIKWADLIDVWVMGHPRDGWWLGTMLRCNGWVPRDQRREATPVASAEETEPPPRPSSVYFIAPESPVRMKIGKANDVRARLRGLQTGSPERLKIWATMPGDECEEKRLHRRFAHLREHGEWFRYEPELRAFVEGLAA